jgi:hypothetical protein
MAVGRECVRVEIVGVQEVKDKDLSSFQLERDRLRDDYNAYTGFYRKAMLNVAYALIAACWAISVKETSVLKVSFATKICLCFAVVTIMWRIVYGYVYALMVDKRSKEIEIDFEGNRKEFSGRHSSRSPYPYTGEMMHTSIFFDSISIFTIIISLIGFFCLFF